MAESPKPKSDNSVVTIDIEKLFTPVGNILAALVLGICIIIAAGRVGTLGAVAGTTTTPTTTGTTTGTTTPNVTQDTIKDAFNKGFIKFGSADNSLVVVEVSDPSCPYCHIASGKNPSLNTSAGERFKLVSDGGSYLAPVEEVRKLVDAGKAAFVQIYSPGHGNGELGQMAMYCGQEKGKYWQVHDKLMTAEGYTLLNDKVKNDRSKSGELASFLSSAVDSAFMKTCLESDKYKQRLADETALASSLGISGTPGFYVNTTNFAGAYSWTDMKSAAGL